MAILTTRAVAATVTVLAGRVRKKVGDRDSIRFTNADVYEAIDVALQWMHNEMNAAQPMTTTSDVTYTGDARSVAFPAGVTAQQVYYVLDVTDSDNPIYVEWSEPEQLEKHPHDQCWSIVAGELAMRPVPSEARTLRLHVVSNYIPISGAATPSTDQHAAPVNFESLIELLAATDLQESDEEIPKHRLERIAELKQQFLIFAEQFRGRSYVTDVRSYTHDSAFR